MSYSIRQNPSPNYTKGRTQAIDKIILHHAATTDFDGIGITFQNNPVSAHYGVGRNNNVDQYVDEADTAWHAGITKPGIPNPNPSSIGIENVNSSGAPDWNVAEETIDTLVELVRDIAKRHGLFPVRVGVNLFQHKDFGNTYCAGQVGNRLQEIADRVNGDAPSPEPAPNAPDQVLHVGERFKFPKAYRVDWLAFVNGIWQIRTNELCPVGFDWNDNGIPAGPVTEVSGGVGALDQVLEIGSLYRIPGEYTVLNLGLNGTMWLAQINMAGYKLWVDVATVEEV